MVLAPPYQFRLPAFEGPLDLLLTLIEREELDITTIALAQVTDQFLAYMADLEQDQLREIVHFLVVAARLLLIKSLALLPRPPAPPSEVEQMADELVQQLQIYKRFKEIAALLHQREQQGLHGYVRVAPQPRSEPQLDMGNVTSHDLLLAFQEVLDALPAPPVGKILSPITVTIEDQIGAIEGHLARRARVRFREILSEAVTRIEVIVTLQALLELIKQDRVDIYQEQVFGPIYISSRPSDEAGSGDVPAIA